MDTMLATKTTTTTRTTTTPPQAPTPAAVQSSLVRETAPAAAAAAAAARTTITSDPGILCFHHCNVKVFCFTLPHICPNCHAELDSVADAANAVAAASAASNWIDNGSGSGAAADVAGLHANCGGGVAANAGIITKLLPFRLPYPFVRATQYPCAIVLRPSTGDFLNDYNNSTDLHIAVTTSTGCIVEFDRNGLRRHRSDGVNAPEWWQCLLVGDVPEPWYDYWDQILMQICKMQPARWTVANYDEDAHNCYTFVLAFLQALGYEKLSEAACSKTSFCERYIVPRTTTAGKYISLYRKLRSTGLYVHPHTRHHHHHQQQHHQYSKPGGKGKRGKLATKTMTQQQLLLSPTAAAGTAAALSMSRAPTLCTIEE